MNQWKVILAVLLIFVSGLGTGMLLKRTTRNAAPPTAKDSKAKSSRQTQTLLFFRSTSYLQRNLKTLSPEQQKQIQEITDHSRDGIREKSTDFRDELSVVQRDWEEAVREVLTPEQARQFNQLPRVNFHRDTGRPSGRPNLNEKQRPLPPPSTNAPSQGPTPPKPKPRPSSNGVG
jgi:hypothetical protein